MEKNIFPDMTNPKKLSMERLQPIEEDEYLGGNTNDWDTEMQNLDSEDRLFISFLLPQAQTQIEVKDTNLW